MRVITLSLILVAGGCASPHASDRGLALEIAAAKERIDLSDGVSEVEAYKIASEHRLMAGAVGIPEDKVEHWRVEVSEGLIGMFRRDVLIDKKTGATRIVDSGGKQPNKAPEPTP